MFDVGKIDVTDDYSNDDLRVPEDFPDPTGSWYLVVYPVSIKQEIKTKSGVKLLMPDSTSESMQNLLTVGMVVRKGSMAYKWSQYKDPVTGEYQPWCEVGDWVCFGRDSNVRAITYAGKKFWIMPDEGILCKVDHPNKIDPRYEFDEEEIKQLREQVMKGQKQ